MKRWSKYIVFAFVIFGSFIGMTILAPQFQMGENTGIWSGMALGFLTALLIPGLRKAFFETVQTEHEQATVEKRYLSFKEMLIHPTYLPMTIGCTWFILCIIVVVIFNLNITQKLIAILSFAPLLISIGLGGVAMIKRGEMITGGWFGYVVKKTKWAIIWGFVAVVIGFGGVIFYIMAVIFDW